MSGDETYSVITSVGKFRVEKTKEHLKVGGKRFCVEIKFINKTPDIAELQWLITKDGGCELDDKPIKDSATIHLLYLSFTLLKKYTPVKTITLLDNSHFDCIFKDETKIKIFMNHYNYLFHGGTWYDIKTNAIPIDPTQKILYNETKPLYNDPSIKDEFDFKNPSLQKELNPIYEKANTWKEFADALHAKYDKTVLCTKISPWYMDAIAILTKKRMLPQYWQIDISRIPLIVYDRLTEAGGKRTRKRKYKLPNKDYTILSPNELYSKNI